MILNMLIAEPDKKRLKVNIAVCNKKQKENDTGAKCI